MPDEVLDKLIKSYMQTDQPVYSFGWQGGEPTLMGLPFFKRVVELQQQYGRAGANVANGLQTNATLIDNSFAQHLSQYRFLIGCSLDGPADVHDLYRRNRSGQPSHGSVIKGIEALRKADASFNILVLVSQANVKKAAEIYRYLVDHGHTFHQYIPCVEFDEKGDPLPFSISAAEWGEFLCELYDVWYPNDTRRVSIRHFDAILSKIVDGEETVCTLGRNCCQYFVVEHNGDIYPCDFFVEPRLKLGNIMSASWSQLLESPLYHDFGAQKNSWNKACDSCDCLDLCAGDCLKHRLYAGNGSQNISYLCEGWQRFVRHTRAGFDQLAGEVTRAREQELAAQNSTSPTGRSRRKPGRNDSCPCGSGRKYKKCCGKVV